MQAIVDHHHADVKTASKVRFAEPGSGDAVPTGNHADDAPSPPLTDPEEKERDDKVTIDNILCSYVTAEKLCYILQCLKIL